MKILAFVDVHGDMDALHTLEKKIKRHNIELAISAGDHTFFGLEEEEILAIFNSWNIPVLLIHGNHEEHTVTEALAKSYSNLIWLHKNTFKHQGVTFVGYGGDGFAKRHPDFYEFAKNHTQNVILITHQPPHQTQLDTVNTRIFETGCIDIKSFIQTHQPIIAISGHIHETAGIKDTHNKTILINPGPTGRVIHLDKK